MNINEGLLPRLFKTFSTDCENSNMHKNQLVTRCYQLGTEIFGAFFHFSAAVLAPVFGVKKSDFGEELN